MGVSKASQAPKGPLPTVETAKPRENNPLTASFLQEREVPYHEGDEIVLQLESTYKRLHPPLVVDVVAFALNGQGRVGKRIQLSGEGSFPLTLLKLTDNSVGLQKGTWQLYVIALEKLCASLQFVISPSSSWITRNVQLLEFALLQPQRGRRRASTPLTGLSPRNKKVDLLARLQAPKGLAGLTTQVEISLWGPDGERLFSITEEINDSGLTEIFEKKISLTEGNQLLCEGIYHLSLSLNGVEVAHRQFSCDSPSLFTAEGELSEDARSLVIAGVPITRD